MRLALSEIRRAPGRFSSIVAALALIVFLVLVLNALADGLYFGATGALRSAGADAYVFSDDGRLSLVRSALPETAREQVAGVEGVDEVGAVGTLLATGAVAGVDGELDLVLFGYEPGLPGGPARAVEGRVPEPGEDGVAAVDVELREDGVAIGDTLTFSGSATPIEVVGFVADASYQLQATVWTTLATWRSVIAEARPETQGTEPSVVAFALTVADGADPATVAADLAAAVDGTETATRGAAVLAIPGVAQQQSTFRSIIITTFLVAGLVVALFFALLTLEKRNLLAMLKALGASTGYLGGGILAQAALATLAGLVLGGLLALGLSLVLPPDLPALFRPQTAAVLVVATLLTGVTGAALSFRRVTRIDPAAALGGTL